MANEGQLAVLRQGSDAWNAWRKQNPDVRVDLSGANLKGADLAGADLRETKLFRADLTMARLHEANLAGANLFEASLTEACLLMANLFGANLSGASLFGADLKGADLTRANLSPADLSGADLIQVKFMGADLRSGPRPDEPRRHELHRRRPHRLPCLRRLSVERDLGGDGAEEPDHYGQRRTRGHRRQPGGRPVHLPAPPQREDPRHHRHDHHQGGPDPRPLYARTQSGPRCPRAELRKRDRTPIVFDFDQPESKNITDTVKLLAQLARYIIVELSDPNSAPYELGVISMLGLDSTPMVPLIASGQRPFPMLNDVLRKRWSTQLVRYQDLDDIRANLDEMLIKIAEAKVQELRGLPPPIG